MRVPNHRRQAVVLGLGWGCLSGFSATTFGHPPFNPTVAFGLLVVACTLISLLIRALFDRFQVWLDRLSPRWTIQQDATARLTALLVIYSVVVVVSGAGLVWLGFDLRTRPLVGPLLYLGGLTSAVFQACVNLLWRLNESNRRLAQTEAAAHTLAFQLRFQPHTIFNALNTIAALIPESPAQAEEATERLARLLRGILGAFEQPHWTLEHEFRILGDLLRIEALRFGTRLQYRLDLPEALASRPLPSLLLLPLVENALKHGFRPRVGPCQLEVRADETGIVVQDDGVGRGQSRHEGLGLKLVRERLAPVGGTMRWLELEGAQGCALRIELSRHWEKDRA